SSRRSVSASWRPRGRLALPWRDGSSDPTVPQAEGRVRPVRPRAVGGALVADLAAPDEGDRVLEPELRDRQVFRQVCTVDLADAVDDVRRAEDTDEILEGLAELMLRRHQRLVGQDGGRQASRP